MIIFLEILVLALALFTVLALFFRVRCPPDHALVVTLRSTDQTLRSGPPAYRVLAGRGMFRLPSTGAVDLLDIGPMRFDSFVPLDEANRSQGDELHAIAHVRISPRTSHLRRAAVRMLAIPRHDLDAIGEGCLAVAVRNAIGGQGYRAVDADDRALVSNIRDELGAAFDELGLEITDLRVRSRHRDD